MSPRYRLVYRVLNFTCIGLVVLVFSVALTPSFGLAGFLMPWVLIGAAYLAVSALFDLALYLMQRLSGAGVSGESRSSESRKFP